MKRIFRSTMPWISIHFVLASAENSMISFTDKNSLANKKAAIRILRLSLLAFSATDLFRLSPKITRKIKRAV